MDGNNDNVGSCLHESGVQQKDLGDRGASRKVYL